MQLERWKTIFPTRRILPVGINLTDLVILGRKIGFDLFYTAHMFRLVIGINSVLYVTLMYKLIV